MSIWIRAVCRNAVSFGVEELRAGIGERLGLLTALYCPEDEEPASEVLRRLRVHTEDLNIGSLRYADEQLFIRMEHWRNGAAQKEAKELREVLNHSKSSGAARVRVMLDDVAEISGFELKAGSVDGMDWPIAIAAAAWIAARGDGLVQADGEGWMEPTAREIRPVLDEEVYRT